MYLLRKHGLKILGVNLLRILPEREYE